MQKVFVNGNSLAVTVPKAFATQMDIKTGTPIQWEKTNKGLLLYTPQRTSKSPSEIDPKVIKLIEKLSKKYSQVWQELAKL
jgi:putative addiction module antidote